MPYRETIQSERLYSRIAESYDRVFERAILAEGRLTSIVRRYMDGRSVLDLACGNGRWVGRFAPGCYVGVDLNEGMLEHARRRFPHHEFVRADMRMLPFAESSFEGVVSLFGAMGHLPSDGQREMVAEVRRVLGPGGIAIFTNGNMWSPFNLPATVVGNRVKIEGVRLRVHSTTPRSFGRILVEGGFEVLEMSGYDYSYLPMMPLKFSACLIGADYQEIYSDLMGALENCRYIPTLRWFGKQLVAVCRKGI